MPTGVTPQEFVNSDPDFPFFMPFSELNVTGATGAVMTWYTNLEDAQDGENGMSEDNIFTESGTYYVTQTLNGCESEPFAVTVSVTMGTDAFAAGTFTFHPNPVKNVLNMAYTDAITSVAVVNLLGQQVLYKEVGQNEAQLDMSPLAAGTYLVRVTSGSAVKTIKVVKE